MFGALYHIELFEMLSEATLQMALLYCVLFMFELYFHI